MKRDHPMTIPTNIQSRYARLLALSLDPAGAREAANCKTAMAALRVRWPGLAPDPDSDPDISGAATWRDAVEVIIDHWELRGRCFSAGEIAKVIRDDRRDLWFGVGELTRFVDRTAPLCRRTVSVPRVTTGKHRTPAGLTVTVYGPSVDLCLAHEFEVEIPRPGPRAIGGSGNATSLATVVGS